MRIFGVDPGTNITGWGIIDVIGNKTIHIDNGCLFVKKALNDPQGEEGFFQKIHFIFTGLRKIIAEYQPDEASIENVFCGKNVQSALKLGHARGSAIIALQDANLPLAEYSPTQIKMAVVGYGRASKNQVVEMIRVLLNLREKAYTDASDALAVALCHATSSKLKKTLNYHVRSTA